MFPRYRKFLPALEEMQVLPTAFVGAIRMVAWGTAFRLSAVGVRPQTSFGAAGEGQKTLMRGANSKICGRPRRRLLRDKPLLAESR
jgi:hypothetical protein